MKRVNITIPDNLLLEIKKITPERGLSSFLANAAADRLSRLNREKAIKRVASMPATFRNIRDSRAYVRGLRKESDRRLKRFA